MTVQTLWEYRVVGVGSFWGTRAKQVEAALNELGQDGWEVIGIELAHNGGKLMVIAKRQLSPGERRRRREQPGRRPGER
jgi:hypothetical protein